MATKRNIGCAQAVEQNDTITITGTVTASTDTVSVTVDNKTCTVTAGATIDTTAEMASAIAEALIATQHDEQYFTADMTINAGGYEYPQFRDMAVSVSGSVVTLVSKTPGVPYVVTVGDTGTGVATLASVTTATGPWHFDAAENWEGGVAPATGDVLVYDGQSSSTYYALDNTVADLNLERRNSFQGHIGLNEINATHGTFTYPEYRQTKLDLPITVTSGTQAHVLGEADSPIVAAGHTYIDMGTVSGSTQSVTINDVPATSEVARDAVLIAGGNDLQIIAYSGSVGVGLNVADNATILLSLELLELPGKAKPPKVTLKSQVTFSGASDTVRIDTGTLSVETGTPGVVYEMYGGTLIQQQSINTINIRPGATVKHIFGNVTTLVIFGGGEFDASTGQAFTITNATFYSGFIYRELGLATYSNGIDFVGCTPADGTFVVAASKTWTPTAI